MSSRVLAFAHPGHGTTDPTSVRHYLLEPVHVVLLVLAVVGAVAVWGWLKQRKQER